MVLFITFVTAVLGPMLFSILVLNEYKARFVEFFRVRIIDLLFQLEQILQIGEMLIIAIIYFNSVDALEWVDTVLHIFCPFIFYIVAYSLQSRKLKVLLNYVQYSNVEIEAAINNKSFGMVLVYLICLILEITLAAVFEDVTEVLKFMQIVFMSLTAYNLLFNVTKVWILSLDTIKNLNSNFLNFEDQFIDQQPQMPRVNLEIVLDDVDPEKGGKDVEGLYGQVCAICLESFVDGSVI